MQFALLAPQALVGFIDAVSYMAVAPSIIFYVLELGGTKDQYGLILSAFSFASFCAKPFLGFWCDKAGYRSPYLFSLTIAIVGGICYTLASSFSGTSTAIILLLLGRGLSGIGAGSSTLGFSYIASVTRREDLTKSSAFLSMMRVTGMAMAPAMNVLLSEINFTIHVLDSTFELNPLNAVGVFLAISNIVAFLAIFFFLKEPESKTNQSKASDEGPDERSVKFWIAVLSPDVMVPVLAVFALNANFQLMETGLAPAAKHILDWGPVSISTLFGVNAVIIFLAIIGVFIASSKGVTDEDLNFTGLGFSILGYSSMYLLWTDDANLWTFALPVVLSTLAFPFLGTSTRSIYTKLVDANPILAGHQGTMQALLSMAASVAGFVAPGLVASYILRSPEDIDASDDKYEFTIYALFAPILSAIVLAGMIYLHVYRGEELQKKSENADDLATETMALLNKPSSRPSRRVTEPAVQYSPKVEAERRATTTLMGIPQFSYRW